MSRATRFLQACRLEKPDRVPIWLMRQAGRYMPEYRALRKKHFLLEMIKTPELAVEATLQPVNAFEVDAAIIFSDILPLLETLGFQVDFVDGKGPVIQNPIESPETVDALDPQPAAEGLAFTVEAVRLARKELDGVVPLIGFSGAPFTLACYAFEGGSSRNFLKTKSFMYRHESAWHRLMEILTGSITEYLVAQASAGAQAVQLFDSWVGALSPADYERYVFPYTRQVFTALKEQHDIPLIHFGTDTFSFLSTICNSGCTVVGVDWRTDILKASDIAGPGLGIQGNLDPAILLAPPHVIEREASVLMEDMARRPGFIFNLGHGVFKETPVDHVAALVDHVHRMVPHE